MDDNDRIFDLIEKCALALTHEGVVPFTRADILKKVRILRPDINKDSVNPQIQGMTVNVPGGAPGTMNRNTFLRVGRGEYVLLNKENYGKYIGFEKFDDAIRGEN
jgi:hypothetical protein